MTDTEITRVVQTLYATISGKAGEPRNWELHDTLFARGAHSYVLHAKEDGTREAESLTNAQYRSTRQSYFDGNDFYEIEVGHAAHVRGNTALVFSDYESRRTPDGPAFDQGVNAIMLIKLDGEWRITSIAWEAGPIARSLRNAD